MTRGECPENPHSLFYTVAPFIAKASPLKVIGLNLLSQQVHQVSSVGAGMFPLTRDTIFSHSLPILYQSGQEKSRQFAIFFYYIFIPLLFTYIPHLPSLVALDVALYVLYALLMVFNSFLSLVTLPPLFKYSSTVSVLIINSN